MKKLFLLIVLLISNLAFAQSNLLYLSLENVQIQRTSTNEVVNVPLNVLSYCKFDVDKNTFEFVVDGKSYAKYSVGKVTSSTNVEGFYIDLFSYNNKALAFLDLTHKILIIKSKDLTFYAIINIQKSKM